MSIVKNITSEDNLDWREIVINWEGMGDDVTEIKAGTPMDAEGNIDLDRLYNAARTRVDGKKIPLTIPVIGELRFDVNDVDRLYKYIQEA